MHTAPESQPFGLQPHGIIMEPLQEDPAEVEGVLNPASARGPDGELYLFPRLVAQGNFSRIGVARVRFDRHGRPAGVDRLGVALEPQEPYECNPLTGGGCEDARITYFEPLRQYVMAYTAFSPLGPRIALAVSDDLKHWTRRGLAHFAAQGGVDFDSLDNKDAFIFPRLIENPRTGRPAVAMIHRPFIFEMAPLVTADGAQLMQGRRTRHPSVWISYCDWPLGEASGWSFQRHHRLLSPRASWERLKVGGGAPPVETKQGWLMLYHGVSGDEMEGRLTYRAGAIVLDRDRPERIRYRSPHPILEPDPDDLGPGLFQVVFPTAVDQRGDLGEPDRLDVYYGVADRCIAVGTMTVPSLLPLYSPPGAGSEERSRGGRLALSGARA